MYTIPTHLHTHTHTHTHHIHTDIVHYKTKHSQLYTLLKSTLHDSKIGSSGNACNSGNVFSDTYLL